MKIKKAIVLVAGFGTRFLPATKAMPKQMLAVVDKPVIQYIVEEAVASGIEEVIFVTSRGKSVIEDHFDNSWELEQQLLEKGKKEILAEMQRIPNLARFAYVRQRHARGDGDAILAAKHLVGPNESVAILFGDDIVLGAKPALAQLIDVYEKYGDPVVALREVPKENLHLYGVVGGTKLDERTLQLTSFVEKPKPADVPKNPMAVIGRYVITPAVLQRLEELGTEGVEGELRLANALSDMVDSKPIYGYNFEGERYDCGDKLGFVKATIDFALNHKDLREDVQNYINSIKT